jgi:hypothetical protein
VNLGKDFLAMGEMPVSRVRQIVNGESSMRAQAGVVEIHGFTERKCGVFVFV